MTLAPTEINPALDTGALAEVFAAKGRIHIPGVLTDDSARALHRVLHAETDWIRATVSLGQPLDTPAREIDARPAAERAAFVADAYAEAAHGFHYLFDRVWMTAALDGGETLKPAWAALHRFLNGPDFLGLIRAVTRDERPRLADAQATRYRRGHFLNEHDDQHPAFGRLYAYVLNLTPGWRTDWGGLLTFAGEDGHLADAYVPAFNALNLFRVPQVHAVSVIAPFAAEARYAITGWIRDDRPDPDLR